MLHIETVEPGTFSIPERLMSLEALNGFSLVGRTALSLRYGHRKSVDLDLFSVEKLDHEKITQGLKNVFKDGFRSESKTLKWGEDPVSLKDQTWESVKKFIQQKVSEFLR